MAKEQNKEKEEKKDIVYKKHDSGYDIVVYLTGDPKHDADTFKQLGDWLAKQDDIGGLVVVEHGPRKIAFRSIVATNGRSATRTQPCHYVDLNGVACICPDWKCCDSYNNCKTCGHQNEEHY